MPPFPKQSKQLSFQVADALQYKGIMLIKALPSRMKFGMEIGYWRCPLLSSDHDDL